MGELIMPFIRQVLVFVGGILVTKGLADESMVNELVGSLMAFVSACWMFYVRYNASKEKKVVVNPNAATQILFLPLALGALMMTGCATVEDGNSVVVVNAERSVKIAAETIDTFLKLEYENQAIYEAISPGIHKFANELRKNAPSYITNVRTLTKAFKANRTEENKANLTTAVAVLEAALREAQTHLANVNGK